MVYDIIDALLIASDGQYDVFSNIIQAMSYLAKTPLCIGNPACYWYKTLLEDYVFTFKNSSTLLMGDIVGKIISCLKTEFWDIAHAFFLIHPVVLF